jgi:hypothetical protein
MTALSPDLIDLALRDGWVDLGFLAARLGALPAQLDLSRLLLDSSLHHLPLSAKFDGGAYLERYPDVAAAQMPPPGAFSAPWFGRRAQRLSRLFCGLARYIPLPKWPVGGKP